MNDRADNSLTANHYLDLRRLSKAIGLCERTLRSRMKDSRCPLPAYRVGGKLLFKWSEVERWIQRHRIKPQDVESLVREITDSLIKQEESTIAGTK